MKNSNKKYFKRDIASLDEVFNFISDFFSKNNISEKNKFAVDLSVEEIFTNMVKYQDESTDDIALELGLVQNKLRLIFTGYNVEYFDVSKAKKVNTTASLEERKVGGLGLMLVKKLMDNIKYDYKEKNCRIILTKTLEE